MRFCDLKEKEVINLCDGLRMGFVYDLEFDVQTGMICAILVPGPCRIFGLFGSDSEYVIDYRCIKRIGEDVILVEIDREKVLRKCD